MDLLTFYTYSSYAYTLLLPDNAHSLASEPFRQIRTDWEDFLKRESLSANLRKREELGETLLFYCLVEYHFAEHKTFQLLTKLRSAIKT